MNKILRAAFIDVLVMVIASLPLLLTFFWVISHIDKHTHKLVVFIDPTIDLLLYFVIQCYSVLFFAWILLRDALNLSLGKRTQNVVIIDRNTGNEASKLRKVMRNVPFLMCPPIEFIMKIVDPRARFGDMIANTKLLEKTVTNLN